MLRKTNMDVHHQLCKQIKRRGRTIEWELSDWAWSNQYLEVVKVTQTLHCPWLEIFLHIFVVMIFSIDGRWTFYINKFTFFISIHFCQGFFLPTCQILNVHWEGAKCLFKMLGVCLGIFPTNGPPSFGEA